MRILALLDMPPLRLAWNVLALVLSFCSVLVCGLRGFCDVQDMGAGAGNGNKVPGTMLKHPYGHGGFDR